MKDISTAIFKQRASSFEEQEKQTGARSRLVSWMRVLVFIVGAGVSYYLFSSYSAASSVLALVLFYILFVVVMRWHSRLNYAYNHFKILRELNLQEIERQEGKLDRFDGGNAFIDHQHPYTSDLDIFGANSLFQVINRSVTNLGKSKIASWLQKAAAPAIIKERQIAVEALSSPDQLEWLQHFLAMPRHYNHTETPSHEFFEWLRLNSLYKKFPFVKILLFVLPFLTLAAITAWFYGYSGYIAVFFLVAQYLIGYRFREVRDAYYEKSTSIYEAMESYTRQLKHIEEHKSETALLAELQSQLYHKNHKASEALGKLAQIINFFSYRLSTLMAFFLNTILMWDFYWIFRIERWEEQYLNQVEASLEVLANYEALASMASFRFANPAYALPELSTNPFEVSAVSLEHPLIFSAERIANDFSMQGAGKTIVITGSNMSGKTTFLRTVGINMVLAFAGATVAAKHMRVAPVQVYTAMRTVDNLAESTSSFYAELKRLRILLNLTEQGQPVFYLLDEILKGTNSRDRHLGAMALIRQLHKRTASGLISTHDLELGAMEEELKGSVENYSFNSTIEGDKIYFDYKLYRGICRSFNASKLMQLMGIAIEDEA